MHVEALEGLKTHSLSVLSTWQRKLVQELRALGDTVGVVSKGLSAEAIQTLPQAKYVHPQARESDVRKIKGQIHRGRDLDEQCAVCRMEFETKNVVKVLPCKHIFHPGCVDQWLAINKVKISHFIQLAKV